MSLLPTEKFVQIFLASDPTLAWGVANNALVLVEASKAKTFNFASPCMAGQSDQSVVFRSATDPRMQVRHNQNLDFFITDTNTDSGSFGADSCYDVLPGSGVSGSILLRSINEPDKYMTQRGSTGISLLSVGTEWMVKVSPDISQFIESTSEGTGVGVNSGGWTAGGVQNGSTQTNQMSEDLRNSILNDPGGGLLDGTSGDYEWDATQQKMVVVTTPQVATPAVLPKPSVEAAGLSSLAIFFIAAIVLASIVIFVLLAKKYGLLEKVMAFFKRQQK